MTGAARGDDALSGRAAAYLTVLKVLRGGSFAGETLRDLRSAGHLAGRESALAMRIALGAVRHQVTIEHLLSAVARFERRRVPPELRAIFHTAAYQVIWMDRVPVFAAVDEAVELARGQVGGRAPGMVNAVLRQLARTITERVARWQRLDPRQVRVGWDQACVFAQDVLLPVGSRKDATAHLAAATGERLDRYRHLVSRFGPDAAEQVAWASQALPVTVLHRNPLRVGHAEFQAALETEHDVELTPDAAFLAPSVPIGDVPALAQGLAFVQDTTAHAAASLVEAEPGQRVLDLCAAPGGKSIVLALQMQDRGEVVACDAVPERLARVQENAARLGLTCVRTAPPPAAGDAADPLLGTFDAALVDVPCTNTGVIARRPEARLGWNAVKLKSLVAVQAELLRTAARHVRPGGRLVYSTCSVEAEENEQQVARFLAEHADWSLECEQTTLPTWGPHLSDWRDGGYAARLVRRE